VDPPNPGATPNFDPVNPDGTFRFITENDRAIIKAQHAADLIIWSNHEVVHRILKEALDKAIPSDYKPTLTIGQRGFGNRSIRDIFADLYARYGTVTANYIQNLNLNLYSEWNPADPIESHLLNIETQQVFATKARRPFYTYQLIEASLATITKTRQFKDELKEFTRLHLDTTLLQWHVYKNFWINKYADYERDRTNMQTLGYHGANNAEDDNNSLASLTKAFSSLQSQRTQQDMALQSLLQEVSTLRQMVSNQQAANAQQPSIPTNIQFPPAPPTPPAYYQMPPPPAYPMQQPPPPTPMANVTPATPTKCRQHLKCHQPLRLNNMLPRSSKPHTTTRILEDVDVIEVEAVVEGTPATAATPNTPSNDTTTGFIAPHVVLIPLTKAPTAPARTLAATFRI
jgi:hypothetical protein